MGNSTGTIQSIEIRYLEAKLDKPFGWSQSWTTSRSIIIMKLRTSENYIGWGETYGSYNTCLEMKHLAEFVIGEDSHNINKINNKIFEKTFQSHGFAGASSFMSALDIALYDIRGKFMNEPISTLLGGSLKIDIPVYATGLYYLEGFPIKPHIDEALGYIEDGFTGMKMKVGGLSISDDAKRVNQTREAIGPNIRLMIDANEAYDKRTALEMSELVHENNLTWFEEPCPSRDFHSNRYVTDNSKIPISGGESLHTSLEFSRVISENVFDIIQPDICSVGGVSEMRKVGNMANSFGVKINPHYWGTGISFAAVLHCMSVQPILNNSQINSPYENQSVLEFDQTPHPIREELTDRFILKGSSVEVPKNPGLGIEINEEVLDKYLKGEIIHVK